MSPKIILTELNNQKLGSMTEWTNGTRMTDMSLNTLGLPDLTCTNIYTL